MQDHSRPLDRCSVLRLELIAQPPFINQADRFVGTKDQSNGRYYYAFRSVDANVEGVNVGGGADIFEQSPS